MEEKKALDLLSQMTLNEKIDQLYGIWGYHCITPWTYRLKYFQTKKNKRLKIPAFIFTDGPKGINLNRSTCFPVAVARGASWDTDMEERVGNAMGLEARHQGANSVGSTCINLIRHPSGGRSQESYGADPFHVGFMGAALVRGLKKNVMPVVKHFACNNIENTRYKVNVNIDDRTLREIYLPHFKRCLDEGPASIMSAYNKINGDFCSENHYLLTEILKNEWNFDGFIISDWFLGTHDTVKCLNAGLDIEMPVPRHYTRRKIKKAILNGSVTEDTINEAVKRILRQKIKYGLFNGNFKAEPETIIASRTHTDLALEVAHKSMVLLKNDSILPLDKNKTKTIAVIGKLSKIENIGDIGSSAVKPPWVISALEGIRKETKNAVRVNYASGNRFRRKHALKVAQKADVVIIIAGLKVMSEGEFFFSFVGGDRKNLELPKRQQQLINDIANVNKKCIVVLEGGSAICMNSWIDNVAAVLLAWYPGMHGGTAIADILVGNVNPSGKLPLTIPTSTGQIPQIENQSLEVDYGYWHDYRYFDKYDIEPQYPFGYGLSYTTYRYGNVTIDTKEINSNQIARIHADVKNTGNVAGEEIVQLYIGYRGSKVERSVKEIKGFRRLALDAGEKKTVSFEIEPQDLAYWDTTAKKWVIEPIEYTVLIGPSSKDLPLCESFKIIN
ncbi:MAG: glycosyl hydrolase [Proteobacteria bacterium]|nr:glycosyl hydrolase [Pseudomonadota bacterium]